MSRVLEFYKYLHTIPESSMQEYKTAAFVAKELSAAGITVETNLAGSTGLVGIIDSGVPGPVFGLRADMDALNHNINGKVEQRHTCGHDGHTSMLLAAALEIKEQGLVKKGKLKVIFQPGEETDDGAKKIIESGVIDDIEILIGMHIRPLQECPKGALIKGMMYSASHNIRVTIKGAPAHGARPHLGINAIDAAVNIISAANAIHMDPKANYSIKCTRCIADAGAPNAIPEYCYLNFDMRADSNEIMDGIKKKMKLALENGAAAIGAEITDIEVGSDLPAAVLDEEITELIGEVAEAKLGKEAVKPVFYTPGGEDFFRYKFSRPNLKVGFMGLGVGAAPGLHHPDMSFDTEYLENGVTMHKGLVEKILG